MSDLQRFDEWRSSSFARPHFLFVCDHGTQGDHSRCDHSRGCIEVDRVALLPWFPNRPGWSAAEGIDEVAVVDWPMEGDQRGHDPQWLEIPGWPARDPDEPDLRRDAVEIRCLAEHCTTWAYRSDDDKLQTLLTKIATDENPCSECGLPFAVTVSADDKLIVMKLQSLHLARKHAEKHYGLRV